MDLARVTDPSRRAMFASFGAALFILLLGALDPLTRGAVNFPALIPPFGASTVIVFFAADTPASRAWNVVVGHLASALIAALVLAIVPLSSPALQAALAVSGAALVMVATKSIHPPGGATALLAVLSQRDGMHAADFIPLLLGCLTLVAVRRLIDMVVAFCERRREDRRFSTISVDPERCLSTPPGPTAD